MLFESHSPIRTLTLEGSSFEIGLQHGTALKSQIHQCLAFYKKIFKQKEEDIFLQVEKFKALIQGVDNGYCQEIEGIAKGAEIDPRWIYALNSRTELFQQTDTTIRPKSQEGGVLNECTTVCFPESSILGQDWDWGEDMEPLQTILIIKRTSQSFVSFPTIMMMTEPGIIGKIGMNSSGLGTTLNLLSCDRKPEGGVPIHVMLRVFLDCHTIEEVEAKARKHGLGKCSSITVADSKGAVRHFEFHPLGLHIVPVDPTLGVVYRTNHYLTPSLNSSLNPSTNTAFANSYYRYERARDLITEIRKSKRPLDHQDMLKVLTDQEELKDTGFCIWSRYKESKRYGFRIGTVCTMVMELSKKKMIFLKGPSSMAWTALTPSSPLWLSSLIPQLLTPSITELSLSNHSSSVSSSSSSSSSSTSSSSSSDSTTSRTQKKRKNVCEDSNSKSTGNGCDKSKKQKQQSLVKQNGTKTKGEKRKRCDEEEESPMDADRSLNGAQHVSASASSHQKFPTFSQQNLTPRVGAEGGEGGAAEMEDQEKL